jgi:RNA polymerase sigma-70 factor (sigma-E family)
MNAITVSRSGCAVGEIGLIGRREGLGEGDLSALYAAHRLGLVRLAVLLVDDQGSAEDVVQDAFLGLYRHRDRLRDRAAALGYLRTAVVNGARSALRRRRSARRYLRGASVETVDWAADVEAGLVIDAEHRQVLAAVRRLPERQQEVLALRYWANLSEAEIAGVLNVSRGTVKSQASRAIGKLEAMMKEGV